MATIKSDTMLNGTRKGPNGNLNAEHGYAIFNGHAAATVCQVMMLEHGSTIYGLKGYYEAMGTGTGLTIGLEFPNGEAADDPDFFGTVADSATAGTLTYDAKPYTLPGRAILTVTVTGAAGTGTVDLVPTYKYDGTY